MTASPERLASDFPPTDQRDDVEEGADDHGCETDIEDLQRTESIEQLVEFAVETKRRELERARTRLPSDETMTPRQERAIEQVAVVITYRLVVGPAAALCRHEAVDDDTIRTMLELFDLEVERTGPNDGTDARKRSVPTADHDARDRTATASDHNESS